MALPPDEGLMPGITSPLLDGTRYCETCEKVIPSYRSEWTTTVYIIQVRPPGAFVPGDDLDYSMWFCSRECLEEYVS